MDTITGSSVWDVVVAGAGPAGSVAANRCARSGLKCLLLEKAALPRNKVCSGMLMSRMAQQTVRAEFGEMPVEILAPPRNLKGYMMHLPSGEKAVVEWKTPIGWRRDIDWWMCRRAVASGAVLWTEAAVTDIVPDEGGFILRYEKDGKSGQVRARFVIGADGARSVVRQSLLPGLVVKYVQNVRESYGSDVLDMERGFFHAVFLPGAGLLYAAAHEKDGQWLLELGSPMGQIKEQTTVIKKYFIEKFGFTAGIKPAWADACVEPLLLRDLFAGVFKPAAGNALLAGDAAGLLMPLTGEGIGLAVGSGTRAADAVLAAASGKGTAGDLYLKELGTIIRGLHNISSRVKEAYGRVTQGDPQSVGGLKDCWEATLNVA